MELKVSFEHPLLPSIREFLPCKKISDLNQVELIKSSIVEYPMKLSKIRVKLDSMKPKRFIAVQENPRECHSSTDESIVSLVLPRGKYLITVSLMAKVTNQWIYVNLDRMKTKLIDQQGYYLPS